ncbi:MAG: hypothetical protein CMH85_05630, partial [Novosphingobium sp.]|nr:hypothetical protein [Novosphingobium sp.]
MVIGVSPVFAQETPDQQQDAQSDTQDAAPAMQIPSPPADANLPEVDPVITEREFERLVPALDAADDAELDMPLESIEAFERRLAQEQSDAKP